MSADPTGSCSSGAPFFRRGPPVRRSSGSLHNLALLDNTSQLIDHEWTDPHLFLDQIVITIVGIVGIPQSTAAVLKLEKLVPVSTLVAGAVKVEERGLVRFKKWRRWSVAGESHSLVSHVEVGHDQLML